MRSLLPCFASAFLFLAAACAQPATTVDDGASAEQPLTELPNVVSFATTDDAVVYASAAQETRPGTATLGSGRIFHAGPDGSNPVALDYVDAKVVRVAGTQIVFATKEDIYVGTIANAPALLLAGAQSRIDNLTILGDYVYWTAAIEPTPSDLRAPERELRRAALRNDGRAPEVVSVDTDGAPVLVGDKLFVVKKERALGRAAVVSIDLKSPTFVTTKLLDASAVQGDYSIAATPEHVYFRDSTSDLTDDDDTGGLWEVPTTPGTEEKPKHLLTHKDCGYPIGSGTMGIADGSLFMVCSRGQVGQRVAGELRAFNIDPRRDSSQELKGTFAPSARFEGVSFTTTHVFVAAEDRFGTKLQRFAR